MSVITKLLGNANWTTYTGQLHVGIDCIARPRVLSLVDDVNFSVQETCRLPAHPGGIVQLLHPWRHAIADIVVLARGDGYQLVDHLVQASYRTHLVTPSQLRAFAPLKNSDDWHNAYWLAHLLRAGALPDGTLFQNLSVREAHHYPRNSYELSRPMAGRLKLRRNRVLELLLPQKNDKF